MTRINRLLLIIVVLALTLPTVAHASDYDLEQRVFELEQRALDLEWQVLAAQQRAIDAEMEATSRERQAELDAIFAPPSKPSYESRAFDVPHQPLVFSEPRSMRPTTYPPVDRRLVSPEDSIRMSCAGPNDCWLTPNFKP